MDEVRVMPFKDMPLGDELRQKIFNLLEEEGLSKEKIDCLLIAERRFASDHAHGLNDIIFETTGQVVDTDDWDKDIPIRAPPMGKLKDDEAKGKAGQLWGTMMEEYAFLYLKEKLEGFGWKLKRRQVVNGREYDCLGWKGRIEDIEHPDLAVDMHFPMPKARLWYELPFVKKRGWEMRERLRKIGAKYKYALVGVPKGRDIRCLDVLHSDMKLVFQQHKFGRMIFQKQRKLV